MRKIFNKESSSLKASFVKVFLGLSFFFILSIADAYAAACVWTNGAGTGLWNNAGNWDCAAVPGPGDTATLDGTSTANCTVDADINVSALSITTAYTGTFDNATNDRSVTVSGNTLLEAAQVNLGTATWTLAGNLEYDHSTAVSHDSSTVILTGATKTLRGTAAIGKMLYNLTVSGSYSTIGNGFRAAGIVNVTGTLTVDHSSVIDAGELRISGTGTVNGSSQLAMQASANVTQMDGAISVATFEVRTGSTVVAATYNSATTRFRNLGAAGTITLGAGTFVFGGNTVFDTSGTANSLTIANTTNNPNLTFKGNLTFAESTGSILWQKGSGTLTFSGAGSGTQYIKTLGITVEDMVIDDAGAVKQMTSDTTTDSLTVTAGTLDLNNKIVQFTSVQAVSNTGTIRLRGAETFQNVTNLDIDSGTVELIGDVDAGDGDAFNIVNFGATDYYNLVLNTTDGNDIFRIPAAAISVAGNLTLTNGTFDNATNDQAITVTGNVVMDNDQTDMGDATWTVSGNWDNADVATFNANASTVLLSGASSGTQTIATGANSLNQLTVSNAGRTKQLAGNSSTAAMTVTAGTFDANDLTFSISGNTTINGGTFKTGTNTITFGDAGGDSVTISSGGLEIESNDIASDIVINADTWTNSGGTITFNAGSAVTTTLPLKISFYYDLVINSPGSTYTLHDAHTYIDHAMTLTDGTLVFDNDKWLVFQGAGTVLTIAADGVLENTGVGPLWLSGNVTNNGTVDFDSVWGPYNPIGVYSSSLGSQRNWQGSGTFNFTDVQVRDQGCVGGSPASITANSSTDLGGNTNWLFPGAYSGSRNFDGSDDYYVVDHNDALNPSNAITIMAWINPDTLPAEAVIVRKSSSDCGVYTLFIRSGNLALLSSDSCNWANGGTAPVTDGVWQHVAATYDGTNIRYYINGVLTDTRNYDGVGAADTPAVGIGGPQVWGLDGYFDGRIADLRIYSRALSSGEVSSAMHCFNEPADDLVGHWMMWDNDGAITLKDGSSYDHNTACDVWTNLCPEAGGSDGPPSQFCGAGN